jgi:hypothetical protein
MIAVLRSDMVRIDDDAAPIHANETMVCRGRPHPRYHLIEVTTVTAVLLAEAPREYAGVSL